MQIPQRAVERNGYGIYTLAFIVRRRFVKRFKTAKHATGKKFLIRIFGVAVNYRDRSLRFISRRKAHKDNYRQYSRCGEHSY